MSFNQVKKCIMVAGTLRGGSSVVYNALNAHSKIMILGEYVHFFRFIYKHYDPLNRINVERLLDEMHARLYWRYRVEIDKDKILSAIDSNGYTYQVVYDAIMTFFLEIMEKDIPGEDAADNWKSIPEFLSLFSDAKVIQVYRDPRAVVASWKKSSRNNTDYMGVLFNCIDNMKSCSYYKKYLSPDVYYCIKYEDMLMSPERIVRELCDFIDEKFEPLMIQPEKWNELFDGVYMKRGWSSHVGEMKEGFDLTRINAWNDSLDDWELCMCETIANDCMKELGYRLSGKKFDTCSALKWIDVVRENQFLYKLFSLWLPLKQGSDAYPSNPRDPYTWGIPLRMKERFVDTDDGKAYLKVMDEIRKKYSKK